MNANIKYRKKLKQISDELRSSELGRLKQLCAEEIPASKRERAMTGQQLFTFMEEHGLIERKNLNYLIQLLERIQRYDIIRKFDLQPSEEELSTRKTILKPDHSFRGLVDVLSEGLTSSELESLKDLLVDSIPGGRRQYLTNPQSFFAELESRGLIGHDNLDFLIDLMEMVERMDLKKVVKTFIEKKEVVGPTGAGGHALTLGHQQKVAHFPVQAPISMDYETSTTHPFNSCSVEASQEESHNEHASLVLGGNKQVPLQSQPQQSDFSTTESGYLLSSPQDDAQSLPTMSSESEKHQSVDKEKERSSTDSRALGQLLSSTHEAPDAAEMRRQLQLAQEEKTEKENHIRELQHMLDKTHQQKEGDKERFERKLQIERQRLSQLEEKNRNIVDRHRQELAFLQSSKTSSSKTFSHHSLPRYSMTRNPRGLAVIFNIENFQKSELNLGNRQGTSVDVRNLNSTFRRLQFDVKVHNDPTSSELVRIMTMYGQRDHSNYDCFVCCLLTHGKKDFLYGSDSQPISISEITSKVNGLACPSLNNKPRLFFIQACRGTDEDKGVETDALPRLTKSDAQEQVKTPLGADFFIGYSTPPETVSFRSTTHGSWYICTLVAVLNEYASQGMSLTDMLTLVNHRLAQATTSEGLKQIPSPINQLTKQLIFTPL